MTKWRIGKIFGFTSVWVFISAEYGYGFCRIVPDVATGFDYIANRVKKRSGYDIQTEIREAPHKMG